MNAVCADVLRQELENLLREPDTYPGERFSGRGIVVCAVGPRMLTNAYVLVRLLREHLGCSLPIEIWHLGAREMPVLMAGVFSSMGCRIVDAHLVRQHFPAEIHDAWQLKAHALMHCAFEEVLLLDADQMPVSDPAPIFDWPQFRRTGAIFWPDTMALSAENPVWEIVGLTGCQICSWDCGQLCASKARHWRSLRIVLAMAERADVFYQVIYGDKDMFLLAWTLTGADSAIVPHPPLMDERYLGQRDFDGKLLLQHCTICKWSLHEPPYRPEGFVWQTECEALLEDLRAFWNERDFVPPPRSTGARAVERELVAQRRFTLTVGMDQPVEIELLPGHQIGVGRSYRISNWHVEETGDGHCLVFHDYNKPSYRLVNAGDRLWQGRPTAQALLKAILEPASDISGQDHREISVRSFADEFIDAALCGRPAVPFDAAALTAALRLLARLESGTAEEVARRARQLSTDDPEISRALQAIADELKHQQPETAGGDPCRNMGVFDDARYYVRH